MAAHHQAPASLGFPRQEHRETRGTKTPGETFFSSVQFSCSDVSDSLGPGGLAILAGGIHPVGYHEFLVDETQTCTRQIPINPSACPGNWKRLCPSVVKVLRPEEEVKDSAVLAEPRKRV